MARLSEVAMRPIRVKRDFSSRREASRARLSEMVWCNHYYTLAQVRRVSLSEADGLAWARVLGLSENVVNSMFVCAL
ncbi:hypothetical protein DEO72_LG5g1607 [Vigna unguiculata]|uniref:Uncharacterized protein n=1 Tax=Vigna unguiculata TaxID=3917 RepID=A0A4D6LXB3_VIGUN|nr:hypothetical protein DEO72_LG5g1607 [Vigna unguiculata]